MEEYVRRQEDVHVRWVGVPCPPPRLLACKCSAGGRAGGHAYVSVSVSVGISSARIIGGGKFYNSLIYSCFEIAGAAAAAGVFFMTHPSEYAKGDRAPILGAKTAEA